MILTKIVFKHSFKLDVTINFTIVEFNAMSCYQAPQVMKNIFTDAGRLKAAEESKYHAKTHH